MKINRVTTVTPQLILAFERLMPQLNTSIPLLCRENLETIISSGNTVIFICEDRNKIVGTLTFAVCYLPSGIKAWIEDVVVDETVRGKGYGKELILHAIEYARNQGITKINLTSSPFRKTANKMYQKLGFQLRETNVYRMELD